MTEAKFRGISEHTSQKAEYPSVLVILERARPSRSRRCRLVVHDVRIAGLGGPFVPLTGLGDALSVSGTAP